MYVVLQCSKQHLPNMRPCMLVGIAGITFVWEAALLVAAHKTPLTFEVVTHRNFSFIDLFPQERGM